MCQVCVTSLILSFLTRANKVMGKDAPDESIVSSESPEFSALTCKKQKMMTCYGRDRVQAGVGPINSFST